MMSIPKVTYFDTNVIRDLSELRNEATREKVAIVKRSIENGKLVVAPSFEVLYEIISSPDASEETRNRNAEFYDGLVDWKYALKPSQEILEDDVSNWVRCGAPSTPYCALDADQSGFIQSIRKGTPIFPNNIIERIMQESQSQNRCFIDKVFDAFVKQLPTKAKHELKNNPEEVWKSWWVRDGFAEIIGNSLVHGKQTSNRCSILSLPTVRVASGYLLHTWYQQIVAGARPKPTAHYDFRHAVLGAGVGLLVTQDKPLRYAIRHVPNLSMGVFGLDEFIDRC